MALGPTNSGGTTIPSMVKPIGAIFLSSTSGHVRVRKSNPYPCFSRLFRSSQLTFFSIWCRVHPVLSILDTKTVTVWD